MPKAKRVLLKARPHISAERKSPQGKITKIGNINFVDLSSGPSVSIGEPNKTLIELDRRKRPYGCAPIKITPSALESARRGNILTRIAFLNARLRIPGNKRKYKRETKNKIAILQAELAIL
jgi:hypothetical protein